MTGMLSLWMLACAEPGTLGPVVDALADRMVDEAQPAVALALGVSGMVAEVCDQANYEGYAFTGGAAAAMGASEPRVTASENGTDELVFEAVGLADDLGTMVWTVDETRTTFSIAWVGASSAVSGDLEVARCAASPDEALIEGALTHLVGDDERAISLMSEAAVGGLLWEPPDGLQPSRGQVRWARASEGEVLIMDDAAGIADQSWLGDATGPGWEARIALSTL